MRIATWNLERGGRRRASRAAQAEMLCRLGADVVVLTEPPASYRAGVGVVTSPAARQGRSQAESWIAIVGPSVEPLSLDLPYNRLAAAVRANVQGRAIIVYGGVLPWLAVTSHARDLVADAESSFAAFRRVLAEQAADVANLQRAYGEPVIWAGDFNQTVVGSLAGGSAERRQILVEALGELRLAAWNGGAGHARPGLCAIDLICGPRELGIVAQGRIDPACDGITMSDHAGYWVDI